MTKAQTMLCRVIASFFLLVVLMVSGSAAVTCYKCDPCPATVDSSTETCEGNACKLVAMGGKATRSCDDSSSGRIKNSCTMDMTDDGPIQTCLCNGENKCTEKECGCANLGGIVDKGKGDMQNGNVASLASSSLIVIGICSLLTMGSTYY